MSHKSVRLLIQDVVKSIQDNINFSYARASDANSQQKKFPYVRLDPLNQSIELVENQSMSKTFNVGIVFYDLDKKENDEANTAKILDAMDLLSDKFLAKMNGFGNEDATIELSVDTIEMSNIVKRPFIKVFTDSLTGYIVEFDLLVPDTFDYCSVTCE